jgi:PAS domain S-box-containing protein
VGLFVCERDRTVFVNQRLGLIAGREPGELLDEGALDELFSSTEADPLSSEIRRLFETDADDLEREGPLVRPDGTERIVEYAATSDIVPGQHLSILRDVTERTERERVKDGSIKG